MTTHRHGTRFRIGTVFAEALGEECYLSLCAAVGFDGGAHGTDHESKDQTGVDHG
jgi:hypothetical protein